MPVLIWAMQATHFIYARLFSCWFSTSVLWHLAIVSTWLPLTLVVVLLAFPISVLRKQDDPALDRIAVTTAAIAVLDVWLLQLATLTYLTPLLRPSAG